MNTEKTINEAEGNAVYNVLAAAFILSGKCRIGDVGEPTPLKDFSDKDLFVGDIVIVSTIDSMGICDNHGLSVVCSDKWKSYSDGTHVAKEGKIKYFTFRDKKIGWGINGKVMLSLKNKKTKSVKLWQSGSSYLYYFIKGWLYRENWYRCKYAGKNRPGDITLGDYWGIEKQHPEYLNGADGWDESNGISVVIANTSKGLEVLNEIDGLEMRSSTFEKAAYGNKQLMHPSEKGKRQEILEQYRIGGWDALENRYQKKIGIRKYASQVKALIPLKMKRWLKGRI